MSTAAYLGPGQHIENTCIELDSRCCGSQGFKRFCNHSKGQDKEEYKNKDSDDTQLHLEAIDCLEDPDGRDKHRHAYGCDYGRQEPVHPRVRVVRHLSGVVTWDVVFPAPPQHERS